ncbi:hypothetical protein MO973_46300 [Paenibacillus sp. TRM 82003]|uniref:hypothetical protein n=1 Tax=Kineococcus sp. TRM81007 TaxID=2925831 RepID=UPI001F5643BE|nr:hypothetical protein [Kineococcus sp. TRM81007]MCI2240217.1 hypothetical protein [Kineococcus sp. TRM81007]MCI3927605.1 hypothetical protein [Paenibacillus sp. TRM 82003]
MDLVVLTTLIVTFVLVVGLAVAVLLSVAAPPMRARGSRLVARLDALAARWAPVALRAAHRARVRAERTGRRAAHQLAQRLAAHRARSGDEAARAR